MPKTATKRATAPQQRALALLAAGESVASTARQLKLTPRTVFRWRKDPKFQKALDALLAEVEDETRDRLKGLLPKALDLLDRELSGNGHPAIRASREILDRVLGKPTQRVEMENDPVGPAEVRVVYTIPDNGRWNPAATVENKGGERPHGGQS